jgi:uncharacterized protein (DUF305 family)
MKHRRIALAAALALCVAAVGIVGLVTGRVGGEAGTSAGQRNAPAILPGRPGQPNKTVPATRGTVPAPGAADIRFVEMMVPHHQQALEMAVLAPARAASAKVKALADRIDAAQRAEISQLRSWLRQHIRDAVRNGHGQGSAAQPMLMPGMATPRQLAELKKATGESFDRFFISLMIAHHQGALSMAQDELTRGTDVLIEEMAQEIVVTQTAEIIRMRALL